MKAMIMCLIWDVTLAFCQYLCGNENRTHTHITFQNIPVSLSLLIICHFGYTLLGSLIIFGQILAWFGILRHCVFEHLWSTTMYMMTKVSGQSLCFRSVSFQLCFVFLPFCIYFMVKVYRLRGAKHGKILGRAVLN